jgi:hypothetical protein
MFLLYVRQLASYRGTDDARAKGIHAMIWYIVAGFAVGLIIAGALGFFVFYEFTNAIVSSSVLGSIRK